MKTKVKTRMAPSPTGEFHIGGMRTLLFNWAFARKHKGEFIIRIEDTDRERFVEGATERILKDIKDYGLDWDGEVTVQSERLEIYQEYIKKLIEKGEAYPCFCTTERLTKMREEQKARGIYATKYDRKCLNLSKGEIEKKLDENTPHVIRLKLPENKDITFQDKVLGKVTYNTKDLDDQVLIKSDGFPTYHFAVVVDDHLMEITHVMRGNEWLPSTPKHILLYDAFGWEKPLYAHLPNLKGLGQNKKLSKREGSVAAREFLNEGYLPEALLNFLMLLGWSSGENQEIYSLNEFIEKFDIDNITKADLVVFDRDKLRWMNGEYIKKLKVQNLKLKILEFYNNKFDPSLVEKIIPLVRERISTLKEFESIAGFFFEKQITVNSSEFTENYKEHINSAISVLEKIEDWNLETINEKLMSEVKEKNYKTGDFFMSLRIAITGQKVTPPINDSIAILGKEETLSRLKAI